MSTINLFYLSLNTTGGWVTFTAHLAHSLIADGHRVQIHKIGPNTEQKQRPFGYGLTYLNVNMNTAKLINAGGEFPGIIVALAKQRGEQGLELLKDGARIVVHDPAELRSYLRPSDVDDPWVIRKVNAQHFEKCTFIRHPYVPLDCDYTEFAKEGAISVSRIDFDKNTTLLLDANRLGANIDIRGFENRLYTRFKVCPQYPEWKQSIAAYDRQDPYTAVKLMLPKSFMVDMSLIKGDGGGTQYTFLEAWNAGTIPVIHNGWIRDNDDMQPGVNCFTAESGSTIAAVLKANYDGDALNDMAENNLEQMEGNHGYSEIVPQVLDWLRRV